MTTTRKLATVLLTGLFLLLISAGTGSACRMYAAIGNDLPDGILDDHLRSFPNSLYFLSSSNNDGWGIGYYPEFGALPSISRGEPMARSDPAYTAKVQDINTSEPRITMAHVRLGTTGCDDVPNPHPFYRDKIGKRWLFEHNGGVTKSRMYTLLGDYVVANPPNGSDISACASGVVDSELYFLFVLKKIEEYGWNVVNGSAAAIRAMVAAGETTSGINFVLSNGETLWAFRRGGSSYTLYYLYDQANGYSAVASTYPTSTQGDWALIDSYQLVVLTRNAAPVVISDVRTYCPGDIDKDGLANATDLTAFAQNFGRSGNGNLDFDADVDGSDLAALVAVYGQTCP